MQDIEEKYLENKICKFRPLKKIDLGTKKKLFFLSLFKMRSGGYKNFDNYLNGIKKINSIAKENDMEIRIFIDNTIYSDNKMMDYLNNLDRVTLILYECCDFLIDNHHVGLFGTLVRFFPLFDFPNNDSEAAFIVDADVVERFLKVQLCIYDLLKNNSLEKKIHIAYGGNFFHINMESNKKIYHNGKVYMFPYCIADRIIGLKKIPPKSFLKFMKKIMVYMNEKDIPKKILSNYYISPKKYKIKCENNICFGIDEYYLNQVLFKYLLRRDKPFCYLNLFDMADFNYYKNPDSPEFRNRHSIVSDEYREVYKNYMKKVGLDKYTYDEIDKKIYTEEEAIVTPFMKEYADSIIYLMDMAKKQKDNMIFREHDYYYLNDVDYKKYYKLGYLRFININLDDYHIKVIKY
jgi:hypothetical protein